jgi:hypothetical protein
MAGIARVAQWAHRPGVYQCKACREQFTITVKTVFEKSRIPLSKWLTALFLMTASKKAISGDQVHRMLGVSYKSTWFMCHRLREAMGAAKHPRPLGGHPKIGKKFRDRESVNHSIENMSTTTHM